MPTVLVVGATRGIGLEFARQYAADGARVFATFRRPQDAEALRQLGARALPLDALDPDSVAALGQQLDGQPLDLVLLVAGVYGPDTTDLAPPSREQFDEVMHTNVLAPMQLISLLGQNLEAAQGKLAALSSRMGSIGLATGTDAWLYRASKAALNSVIKTASIQLGARGVVCMALSPGWVRTDMGGPSARLDVRDSVTALRRVIAAANRSHNGRFLHYTGEQLEW
ncbi:MAG TPA: SDR family oxidoreductase [Burkholderiaceae bacterium]|jgi:NAD(P)-dependent dehydrogenase (short-subunit alcohol dehydrogenase family)|nr:SDR family oxidoreductase [Burkholderiaceae bacterium]